MGRSSGRGHAADGAFVGQPVFARVTWTPCKRAAQWAYYADLADARSEYRIESGKALNISDFAERKAAFLEAWEDFLENTENAYDVYGARWELCLLLGEHRYDPEEKQCNRQNSTRPHLFRCIHLGLSPLGFRSPWAWSA